MGDASPGRGLQVWLSVLVSTGFPSPWGRNTVAPGAREGTEVGRQKRLDHSPFWKLHGHVEIHRDPGNQSPSECLSVWRLQS